MKIFLGSQLVRNYRSPLLINSAYATVTIRDEANNVIDNNEGLITSGNYYIQVVPHNYYRIDNIRVNNNENYVQNSLVNVAYRQSLEITVECSNTEDIVQTNDNIKIVSTGATLLVVEDNLRIGG